MTFDEYCKQQAWRATHTHKEYCKRGHKLTPDNTLWKYSEKGAWPFCKLCDFYRRGGRVRF